MKLLKYIIILLFPFIIKSQSETQRYYNITEVYSLEFPKEWRLNPRGGELVAAESEFDTFTDKYHEHIDIVVEELPESRNNLKKFSSFIIEEMHTYIDGIKILKKGKTTINDLPARWLKYSFKSDISEVKVTDKAFLLVNDKKGYIITCSAETDRFESYWEKFEKAVYSFKLDTVGYNSVKNVEVNHTDKIYTEKQVAIYKISNKQAQILVRVLPKVKEKSDQLMALQHKDIYLKTLVIKSPSEESPHYHVEVGETNPFNYRPIWTFKVDADTGDILYFNSNTASFVSLQEWK